MIGIPAGLLYANAVEWLVHRYVLHGPGKNKDSFWRFHWAEHHKNARRNRMYDADYEKSIFDWNARGKEAFGIGLMGLGHLPLFPVAPYFTATVLYACGNYLHRHKKSHLDPEWGRVHMTGHYDHHMGLNQDSNWCVTRPWFDWIMGTRERYAFTAKETSRRLRSLRKSLVQRVRMTLPKVKVPTLSPPPEASNESRLGAA
jgi:hypothetical protein